MSSNETKSAPTKGHNDSILVILGVLVILVYLIVGVSLLFKYREELSSMLVGLFSSSPDNPEPTGGIKLDENAGDWDGDKKTNFSENNEEYITIPGYTGIVVSSRNPSIQLYNPPENTVYFKYTVLDSEGMTLFSTDAIPAGGSVWWNVFDDLGKGTHEVTIQINTVDVATLVNCNGSSQTVRVIVQ